MSLYLGSNLVSGVATPVQGARNIGQIIQSTIPLTDAGLHLLDGSLISGSGAYGAFVDYIAGLYNDDPKASYFCQAESLQPWTQPVLTSNGTMGGDSYACDASSVESDYYAWKAFDNDTSTRWGSSSNAFPDWITFYSPVPLRVLNVYLHFYVSTEVYSAGEIQGSNDNSTWTTLASFNNNSSLELNVSISTNVSYKYIRFYGTATVGSPWGKISEFKITAQQEQELTAEQVWQQSVTNYGVCGKFVYDSQNNTVRLPKITGFTEGTIDPTVLGDLVQAGLPNITGYSAWACNGFCDRGYSSQESAYNNSSGALYATLDGGAYALIGSSGSDLGSANTRINIDASHSSSIYGNSTTVQPQAIKVLYYIVIANSTKTNIEVDIDEVMTDLNGKADVDLSNVLANIDYVVETQLPTAENNYTWCRKYKSGWIEQGGRNSGTNNLGVNTLVKEMADISYEVMITRLFPTTADDGASISIQARSLTTTSFIGRQTYSTATGSGLGSGNSYAYCWEVKGMGA